MQCAEVFFFGRVGARSEKAQVAPSDCLGKVLSNFSTPVLCALEERFHVVVATVSEHVIVNTIDNATNGGPIGRRIADGGGVRTGSHGRCEQLQWKVQMMATVEKS